MPQDSTSTESAQESADQDTRDKPLDGEQSSTPTTYSLDDLLADMDAIGEIEIEDEELVIRTLEREEYRSKKVPDGSPDDWSKKVSDDAPEWSKKVLSAPADSWSKKVSGRVRRSDANDRKAHKMIQKIKVPSESSEALPLVHPPHPHFSPLPATHSPKSSPSLSDTFTPLPSWEFTDDRMKAVAATIALQVLERAVSFTFNLTPERIAEGMKKPDHFLEGLKRDLDRVFKRRFGSVPLYWFSLDINRKGRLHLHGAIEADRSGLPSLGEAMKSAWGEWKGRGVDHQLDWNAQLCNDDWATYALRNRSAVRKIVGDRTMTITTPLRREAKETYEEIRRLDAEIRSRGAA